MSAQPVEQTYQAPTHAVLRGTRAHFLVLTRNWPYEFAETGEVIDSAHIADRGFALAVPDSRHRRAFKAGGELRMLLPAATRKVIGLDGFRAVCGRRGCREAGIEFTGKDGALRMREHLQVEHGVKSADLYPKHTAVVTRPRPRTAPKAPSDTVGLAAVLTNAAVRGDVADIELEES